MQSDKRTKENFVNFTAFFALAVIAVLIIIEKLFPIIGINISGPFLNVLRTLQSVLMLLTLGVAGFNFIKGKKKGWKITYWIIIAIFVVSIVLLWVL